LYELLKADSRRVYVIAETGLNHGGSQERALTMIRAAKWAGADAVRFQTPAAGQLTAKPRGSKDLPRLKKNELSFDAFQLLYKEAQRLGIEFLSTPVDEESADALNSLGVDAFEMLSADISRRPLLEHVSRKGKPVLLSTGMSTSEEIEQAIDWVHTQSNDQIVLLHGQPANSGKPEDLNLKSMEFLRDRFGAPVGFSDYSAASLSSIVAVSLGAQVIERRFMVEHRADATDTIASMDAKQLKAHIEELRSVGAVLGQRGKYASESENRRRTPPRSRAAAAAGGTLGGNMLYALQDANGTRPEFDRGSREKRGAEMGVNERAQWELLA
jgi:sialic acid synthase SpsE